MSRLIFHVDVNSAYLSWEAARRVSLGEDDIRLIPSAIGGDRDKRTGVILAKSIPAKKFGIKTGEPVAMALRKCPDLFLTKPDFIMGQRCYAMYNKKPPFEITNTMLDEITDIAELVGHLNATAGLSTNPMLRRSNRIRSVYSSLAIEQNTLSLEQVTAVLNGKRVIAPPKDIAEVKNAYEIYEMMDSLDPYSIDDLLNAHAVMTRGLTEESGCFRSGPVGVLDKQGNILHFGTLPDYAPGLTMELLDWVKESNVHMLIKSCVFHYELELIHPFADGIGRIGRLWHTLLLTQWKSMFAWLPIESIIHDRQDEYYAAINHSNYERESTIFIEFMLSAIKEALMETVQTTDAAEGMSTEELRWYKIERFMKRNGTITNADVRQMFNVSSATANRILVKITDDGRLQKIRMGRSWGYQLDQSQ